jgi:folate-binding protein YgfZ
MSSYVMGGTSRAVMALVKTTGAAQGGPMGEPAADYEALRHGAGVYDLADRSLVVATGADRVGFLQGMLTNDVARLGAGDGCAALLLTIQGRVVSDLRVAATETAIVLDVARAARDAVLETLGRLIIADDVELVPDDATSLLGVSGPAAPAVVPPLKSLAPFGHVAAVIAGVPVRVVRASAVGGEGAVLHVAAGEAAELRAALVAAGALACGTAALEARRIEEGIPRLGPDMGEKTLALEVPVEAAISSTKGCYLGQEVIARGTARGHVNRRLCGLVFTGGMPAAGAALVHGGHEIGQVTSVAHSPAIAAPVGLGFVRREHWEPGTALVVAGAVGVEARVAAFPLA